jgi:UDP-GlcNAc:undecaprenyl-phosphate/decaprenyl-phosphate GlcNAc-1-phosphate transferase
LEIELDQSALLLFFSFAFVGAITPIVRKFAIRLQVVDRPSESHKTHQSPVPYMGGVAIVLGVLVTAYGAILWSRNFELVGIASTVLLPAVFMGAVGLIDDIKKLSPWPRFIVQNLVGIAIAFALVVTNTLGSPTGNTLFDILISVFWIVGITNSINFFDNVDGGASGAIAIASLSLFILALQGNQYFIAALSIVLSGSTVGFLLWNKPPARIYMGDAGALFLGVLIATLTLRFNPNPIDRVSSFAIPILLLAVPILDTTVAVLSRLRRKVSPFQGGQDHLSHRLMRAGFRKKPAVLILWCSSLAFSSIALAVSSVSYSQERSITMSALFVWCIALFYFLTTKDEAEFAK